MSDFLATMLASAKAARRQIREGGVDGFALSRTWISSAHQGFDGELERLRQARSRIEEQRARNTQRMEALNMHFELLVAEKDFTMAEVERLREEEHSLEDNPNLCHVRDALIQCATEYNQLDEKIEEDMQVALVDVQVLSGDVRKVTKDLRKLQKSIDAVETTRKIILSSFEQFFEEANAMIRDWKAEQSLQSSDTRATNN